MKEAALTKDAIGEAINCYADGFIDFHGLIDLVGEEVARYVCIRHNDPDYIDYIDAVAA